MISLIQSIVDFVTSVALFFWHTLTSLFNLIAHIPSYVSFLSVTFGYMPDLILPFLTASISIYVVYLILNRGK